MGVILFVTQRKFKFAFGQVGVGGVLDSAVYLCRKNRACPTFLLKRMLNIKKMYKHGFRLKKMTGYVVRVRNMRTEDE